MFISIAAEQGPTKPPRVAKAPGNDTKRGGASDVGRSFGQAGGEPSSRTQFFVPTSSPTLGGETSSQKVSSEEKTSAVSSEVAVESSHKAQQSTVSFTMQLFPLRLIQRFTIFPCANYSKRIQLNIDSNFHSNSLMIIY